MAKISRLPNRDIINVLGPNVDFYLWKGKIPVARKMPQSIGALVGDLLKLNQGRWSFITRILSQVDNSVMAEAISVAGKSGWIWRDVLTSAAYGKLVRRRVGGTNVFLGAEGPITADTPLIVVTKVNCRFQQGG